MKINLYKLTAAVIILAIIAAAGKFIFFRPSDYTEESIAELFEKRKSSFVTMADYLTEYKVSTTIEGLISGNNRYGVPNMDEDKYHDFNDANTIIMRDSVTSVISYGSKVEFILLDEGGLLNRINAKIVYDPYIQDTSDAKQLSKKNWYLYITK